MVRTVIALCAATAIGAVLFVGSPATACEAHAKQTDAAAKTQVKSDVKADPASGTGTEAAPVLAPVDEILSAKCNCSGPNDCTCRKGQCKCAKCGKHHKGVKKTQLLEPLKGSQVSPLLPGNARYDATAGIFI